MATTTAPFPLATGDPSVIYDGPSSTSVSSGTAEGASGSSPGAVEISHGGMVAIIVVVCVVAILGSKYFRSGYIRTTNTMLTGALLSLHGYPLLCGKEARMEDPGNPAPLCEEGGHSTDASTVRIPKVGEGVWSYFPWPCAT